MYCTKCGKEIPDNAKFCGHCGQPMNGGARPAASGAAKAATDAGKAAADGLKKTLGSISTSIPKINVPTPTASAPRTAVSSKKAAVNLQISVLVLILIQMILYFVPYGKADLTTLNMLGSFANLKIDSLSIMGLLGGSADGTFATVTVIILGIIAVGFAFRLFTGARIGVISVLSILGELWGMLMMSLLPEDMDSWFYRIRAFDPNAKTYPISVISIILCLVTIVVIIIEMIVSKKEK